MSDIVPHLHSGDGPPARGRPRARRLIRVEIAVLLAGAVIASAAIAAIKYATFVGSIKPGGTIDFTASHTKMRRLAYSGVPLKCSGGRKGHAYGQVKSAKVSDDRFRSMTHQRGGATVVITGHFSSNFKSASGTFSERGTIPGYHDCRGTGDHWTATGFS